MSELLYSPAAYGIDLSSKDMPKPRKPAGHLSELYNATPLLFSSSGDETICTCVLELHDTQTLYQWQLMMIHWCMRILKGCKAGLSSKSTFVGT